MKSIASVRTRPASQAVTTPHAPAPTPSASSAAAVCPSFQCKARIRAVTSRRSASQVASSQMRSARRSTSTAPTLTTWTRESAANPCKSSHSQAPAMKSSHLSSLTALSRKDGAFSGAASHSSSRELRSDEPYFENWPDIYMSLTI